MKYISRIIESTILKNLKKKKSILLLGPRQTGKSTFLKQLQPDLFINLLITSTRREYEKNPDRIIDEIRGIKKKKVFVIIDEVQKCPDLMDPIQYLIDEKLAYFILTGSSARKLRRGSNVNLLPGRVIYLRLDAFQLSEMKQEDLNKLLLFGSLPKISLMKNPNEIEEELISYVDIFLEQEVRAEALVRKLANFSRFLEFAACESGNIISFRALSQAIGISHTTISDYYQILEDCLIIERIEPYSKSSIRKKLIKSPKFLFFDLGIRRIAANQGKQVDRSIKGKWFEQFIGLELLKYIRTHQIRARLQFWRDPDGPEIDWLININEKMIPIEVKFKSNILEKDTKHLLVFCKEYNIKKAYIICIAPNKMILKNGIIVLPWQELAQVFVK